MKNGLLIWNLILSLLVAVLVVLQLSSKKDKTSGTIKTSINDTAASNKPFRVAYFEMDSIAANLDIVKTLKAESQTKEAAINTEMADRAKNLQQKFTYYQNLAQSGNLTEAQSEAARKEMEVMDNENKARKAQLEQDYNQFLVTRQNEIKNKLKLFISDYNKSKGYTYIMSDDPGLFYYQDTTYNITADVVRGLNQKSKTEKKK